ncbi:hypothetical protein T459_24245 [Capsicum annuum]|uniref:NB-ARC domain-containing protein n=1 Tax=Capsicum annuum TaxID=4072 RepID=A0A2G2YUN1_CAPAN|nr:hypothetical protein T459_24245 [Capsicum annuum]
MAHASVASLTRTVESRLTSNSPMQSLSFDHREEFCTLHEKVSSLEVLVKNFEKSNVSGELTDLEVQIKKVANIVEQTIQLGVTEAVLANDENLREKAQERISDSLQQVAEDIDRIWKESTNIQDKGNVMNFQWFKIFQCFMIFQWFNIFQWFSKTSKEYTNVENSMVGRDDQRKRLVEDLTRIYSGEPKVIPIDGMGGIGKTTLANEVYNHESILRHFDVRAWATVSQQHNIKQILLSLLQSTIKMDDTVKTKGEAELADMLQKSLKRKRYFIVLDDIWSCEVWDGVRQCFPTEDNAGNRILLTTRNNEVACYAGTENLSMQMDFMDQDESWNLFKSAAFSSEALPYEFETVGKQIADECHGLPLTIVVVAGVLKSKRAIEDWRTVVKDVKSLVTNDPDERCSRVLGLSYNHLTSDLKTCLLHFGIFPEDSDVNHVPSECQSLMQMQPFKRLIGDEIDSSPCDLYRALLTPVHHQLRYHDNNNLLKRTRSIFSFGGYFSSFILNSELIHFKLLKVLELRHIEIDNFPVQILSLIWLRYLELLFRGEMFDIPPEISRLWNLQTFNVKGSNRSFVTCLMQIWGLMQLRHLKLPTFYLPDCPSGSVDKGRNLDFSNL